MSNEQKPGDPADRAADGAFGGVQSHRAGYGDDKLQRLTDWLRAHPTATLASGEGALLLAQIDRITVELGKGALRLEIEMLTVERDRAERILAALREPSANVIDSANVAFPFAAPMIRAAVAAAEQEVGRE